MPAHGVSACDVGFLVQETQQQHSSSAAAVLVVWVRKVRAGDPWISRPTSEAILWSVITIVEKMSGDNEETQTAEETTVDEKVTAGFLAR